MARLSQCLAIPCYSVFQCMWLWTVSGKSRLFHIVKTTCILMGDLASQVRENKPELPSENFH